MANRDNEWYGQRRSGYSPSSQARDDDRFFEGREDDYERRQRRHSGSPRYRETADRRYSDSFRSPRNERFDENQGGYQNRRFNDNMQSYGENEGEWRPWDPDSDDWYAGSEERFQTGGVQQGGYPNTGSDYYRQTTREPRHDYRRPTQRGYTNRDTGSGYASFERHRSGRNYSGQTSPNINYGNASSDVGNAYGNTSGDRYRRSMNDVRQAGPSTYSSHTQDRYENVGHTYDHPERDFSGRGPRNWKRSPERIREDVCERLTHDRHLDAYHIEIEADDDGIVTLSGRVSDRRAKRHAEALCDQVRGVRDVRNRLRIDDDLYDRDLSEANAYQTAGETGNTARTSKNIEGNASTTVKTKNT